MRERECAHTVTTWLTPKQPEVSALKDGRCPICGEHYFDRVAHLVRVHGWVAAPPGKRVG